MRQRTTTATTREKRKKEKLRWKRALLLWRERGLTEVLRGGSIEVVGLRGGGAVVGWRGGSTRTSTTPPPPPHRPLALETGPSTGAATARTIITTSQLRLVNGRSRESGWSTKRLKQGCPIQRETLGEAAPELKVEIEV